jgi:sulfate adenylyltransferase subunit 1 (EFTu-like GTPase family)
MGNQQLDVGEEFILQIGSRQVPAIVQKINFVLDPVTFIQDQLRTNLQLNDIAEVSIRTNYPIAFDRYSDHKGTGSFILIDYQTSNTVAGGMIL